MLVCTLPSKADGGIKRTFVVLSAFFTFAPMLLLSPTA